MSWYSEGRHYVYLMSVGIAVLILIGIAITALKYSTGDDDLAEVTGQLVTPWPAQLIADWGAPALIIILIIVGLCTFFRIKLPWDR